MTDFANLGLRFVPVDDAAANKALTDVAANSTKAESATKKLTATQQSAANAQRMVAEANRLNTSALGQMAQAIQAADAAQRAALASTKNLGTAVQTAAAQAKAASVSFNTFYDAAERDFATQYVGSMNKVVGVHGKAVGSSKAMTQATLNLSRQFADVGVTAAMGMSPLTILIQQGPQIADAFLMAKAQGLGFSTVLKGMWAQLAPILAILAPIALAVGAASAAFSLFHRELSKGYPKDITDGLGLTAEQLERVKGRTVTMGDTFRATLQIIGEDLMHGPVGVGLRWLGETFNKVLDTIVRGAVDYAARFGGLWGATYETIVQHWRQFPQVMGAFIVGFVNATIASVEALINTSIAGINRLTAVVGWDPIANVQLARVKQANNAVAVDFEKTRARIEASIRAGASSFAGRVSDRALQLAQKDALKEAGKAPKGAKDPRDPRDQTDERTAQIAAMLAQAMADELQSRLALTKEIVDRVAIEKQIAAMQAKVKQAQIERERANIADDKGLSDAKKAELLKQLDIVQATAARTEINKIRLIDEQAAAALAKEALGRQTAERELQIDLLASQGAIAKYGFQRRAIDMQVLKLQQQIERLKLEEIVNSKSSTQAEKDIAAARLALLGQIQANQQKALDGGLDGAFNDVTNALEQMADAFKARDWKGALGGLIEAIGTLRAAFKKGASTEGKIGSIAGIAGAAGQAIGGTAGSTLSGAAAGAMAGFQLGTIIPGIGNVVGAIGGAIIGGIAGLLGGNSRKKAEKAAREQAAREAEAQRQAQILQQRRQIEVAYVEATGTAIEILAAQRKAELEGIDESNKAMALALYAAQDQKRRDEEGIALMRQLQAMDDAVLGTTTALTAARQEELKALDPANRYLAELIYARQDEAAAIEKGTALINAQLAYEADAQATWLRDVTNTRKDELASRKAQEAAAQEAAKATAEAFQTMVEKVNASRQALLRAGDVTGAVGGDFSIGKSDLKLTDPNFNARAINELSAIRQRLDNLASADALNVENVGSVIRRVFDQLYDDANVSARQDIIAGLSGGLGLVVRDAIAGLGTFLGDSQIRSRYQARGSGLASVYAASDDYNMVAQQNFIPTAPGEGISSFGADVGAYQLALAQLDGQLRKGTISQDQYGQAVDRVNEMVGASLIELANSTELQLARIDAAAEGLRQAGINSVVYYFGEITKAADALAVASKAANEPISQVTAAIGRLNSISTALGLSASAAGGGDARIDQAKLIAEAARVASQTLTTADAARIAKELAANDNFAGLSTTGLRDIAMLLDGLKAFDPNSFEASFLRLNNALITGAVTSDQYSALFAKAMDVYSGAAEDAAAQAQALAAAAATQHQLDIRLLRARGQDAAAIAIEQADELAAAANDNQRATLRMIYAEETLAKARQEASAAAQASIDKFTGLRDNLRALQVELSRGAQAALSPEAQYLANKAEFDRVSGLAATRDATALAALPDTIRQFLDASKGYFATSQGYFTDLAAAQAAAAGGENAAVTALDLAQQQLNTLDLINASVLGVQDAVLGLPAASTIPTAPTTSSGAPVADEETKQLLRELLVEVRASGIRVGAGLTALLAKGDEIVEAEEGTTRAVRAA